ncbi:MAG TPA: CUAEP/CCAEP-tail radical SAM protein, partial [Thermomicrobiaceae bacterium]|nr:CUAEP/CCAEP-tail radical SAM protein [Thermomicrobiaceae bacterium]
MDHFITDTSAGATAAPVRLRGRGAVLLLSCYELGHQPLNLAFPLAYLRRAGFDPVAVDTAVDMLDDAAIAAASLVAVSVPMHTALRLGTQLARRVRAVNPAAVVCFYGLYAWLNADYLLREHGDYVIGGEYEQPLRELAEALERGTPVPPSVGRAERIGTPSLARIDFPRPARADLPAPRHYAHLLIDGLAVPAGYVEASRGCHHTCLHCPVVPVYGGRFFAVPREVVIDDIRRQVAAGVGHITFGDPDALNGPTHTLRICRALHAEFPRVTFDLTTRIEHILQHREIFPELAALGCVFVVSAVESVSETVLERIDKGHTRADVVEALVVLESAGIAMRPSLLPFTPWTTLEEYLDLLTFVEEHDLVENIDPVHFSIRLLVPPGSALLERPETAAWLGPLDEAAYTYHWEHPDPRVDALQRDVARIAEAAAAREEPTAETFAAITAAAWAAAGRDAPPARPS